MAKWLAFDVTYSEVLGMAKCAECGQEIDLEDLDRNISEPLHLWCTEWWRLSQGEWVAKDHGAGNFAPTDAF
ncbi:hypothetical protein A6E01_20235 (plasmid) [Vibrio breoganii]|uniref:Uncharacterized protein n=1 Tax=Vibrio breoganii TaxID=553239 RepID=A0AAN0XZU4_9VIBR|nr:hypothetical protein [Vibrio breoganii]ANO35543.1 hypothetical protein A6E01_20235 [Vibrio breoganii]